MLNSAIGFQPTLTVDTGFLASVKKNLNHPPTQLKYLD